MTGLLISAQEQWFKEAPSAPICTETHDHCVLGQRIGRCGYGSSRWSAYVVPLANNGEAVHRFAWTRTRSKRLRVQIDGAAFTTLTFRSLGTTIGFAIEMATSYLVRHVPFLLRGLPVEAATDAL